jgi:hypothetical protein
MSDARLKLRARQLDRPWLIGHRGGWSTSWTKHLVMAQAATRRDDPRHRLLRPGAGVQPGAAFSFLADHGGWQRWFFTVLAAGDLRLAAALLAPPPA